ncbi:MAG: flagellar filament capping protein FliD [Halomonas sp.]|nr:flagellar filament capping protein FliD [Halomonas sp.]
MASISSLGIGSGLDLGGLLDQLASAERQKLTPITTQKSSFNTKISAYGQLESALDKFQQAAAKLNGTDAFRAVKSSTSAEAFTVAAGTSAVPGSYSIEVTALAKAQSLVSSGVADQSAAIGTGESTLTINQGGVDHAITIADGSSLEDVRDAINGAEIGVTASIINTGGDASTNPYRLVLNAKDTGTEAAVASVSVSGNADLQNVLSYNDPDTTIPDSMQETVTAQNAALTVNGIAITSASNQVEEAIQGVTLNLSKTNTGSPETLTVSQDSAAITKNVQAFVDAYNSLKKNIDSLTSYNSETGDAGTLLGDSTMRSVESNLRRVMTGSLGEGSMQMLSDVGIELKLDGNLEVDSDKLKELVTNSPEALSRFFGGGESTDGFIDKLDASLETMLKDKGLLDNAKTGLKDRISSLDERYERMESNINSTIERYRSQFADMDMLVSQMNSTMTYLTQQFDAMNAQLGRD